MKQTIIAVLESQIESAKWLKNFPNSDSQYNSGYTNALDYMISILKSDVEFVKSLRDEK